MASITCGSCKQTHATVDEVKGCYYWAAEEEANYLAEQAAERAAERYWEEGTWAQREQYRWEVEQDERNAAFWAGAF